MKVVVIGQGYVGLPLAMAAASSDLEVIGFDINENLIADLNIGKSSIGDVSSKTLAELIKKGKYSATSNPSDFSDATVAVIAVPTPLDKNREPDLSFVISAAELLGRNLRNASLIINESTSYPGTLRDIIAPTVKKFTKLEHHFAIAPERIDPGNANWKISNTPRLFSGIDKVATRKTREFYKRFTDELIEVSTPEVAEFAKLFENTFRQVNIALVNELALITRKLDVSIHEVLEAAETKPYGFMRFNPGLGVGGHCIPVDPTYLAHISEKNGVQPRFINLANEVNYEMPLAVLERIKKDNGNSLSGKNILIFGMAYKPNISDVRESPAIQLKGLFEAAGATVYWKDPLVSKIDGVVPSEYQDIDIDITVVSVLHDCFSIPEIRNSSNYIFDCTGRLAWAVGL
jgi:UDP-N-acetyl-D-glucosamine dehydrogenase